MDKMKYRNRSSFGLLIILLGFSFQGCFAAQTFEKQPSYSEVNPGQEMRLSCKIFSKKGQCSWQKDNKPVGIYLGKYEWSGNPDVGDCSLRILNAALEYDDGEWECQVTASDFAAQDALTSKPVKLVVRVPPNAPQIEFNGTSVPTGKNLTTKTGSRASIKCTSRYGNPPALLKWFVGDEEVAGVNQTNKTEEDNGKKWLASSILDYTFHKSHNAKAIRCVAVHEAYPTKSRETQVLLDVQYPPQVKLIGAPEGDLEENKDSVTLRCLSDANPAPTIVWRKAGRPEIFSFQEIVEFKPLRKTNAGSYSCEAKNFLGTSQAVNVDIDVKFPPKIIRVGPEKMVIAALYNRTVLVCQAEGNPQPSYQWLQKMTTPDETVYVRGAEHMLVIHNVTYEYQGKYFCKATNMISGQERIIQSEAIDLNVVGAPQVLRHAVDREVAVERGSDVTLAIVFCSNPGPSKAVWEWGSLQLEAGYELGRYSAEKIEKSTRDDCYEAKLRISRTDTSDSRHYYLKVENSRGSDRYSVILQVRGFDFVYFADPVSMSVVIGVIIGCLILLVLVVLIILYAFKAEKWCFSQRGDFKPTDLESEKSDMDGSMRGVDGHHQNGKGGFANIPQSELQFGIPAKAATPQRRPQQPELIIPPPSSAGTPDSYHIMKQQQMHHQQQQQQQQQMQRNERSFRSRAYPVENVKKDINYADLQLPKTSNNGSMKKSKHHHQQQIQQQMHLQNQLQNPHHPGHHQNPPIPTQRRMDYAEIQFKPKSNEQAEV